METPEHELSFFAPDVEESPETWGETIHAVSRVPIDDNGERLVDPRDLAPRILFAAEHRHSSFPRTPFVREGVARMLAEAQRQLPPGYRIQLIEGYRPLDVQRALFLNACEQLRRRHPDWSDEHLRECANAWVAAPDIDAPPPHVTGGAVDLTLVDEQGEPVDMTGPAGWTERTAPTGSPDVPEAVHANRRLLCDALSAAGLTNYPGEWWHWSYGEPGWAVRTGHPRAVYGALETQILYEI